MMVFNVDWVGLLNGGIEWEVCDKDGVGCAPKIEWVGWLRGIRCESMLAFMMVFNVDWAYCIRDRG